MGNKMLKFLRSKTFHNLINSEFQKFKKTNRAMVLSLLALFDMYLQSVDGKTDFYLSSSMY